MLGDRTVSDRYRKAKLERLTADSLRRAGQARPAAERYLEALRTWASLGDSKDLPHPIAAERALDMSRAMWWLGDPAKAVDLAMQALDLDPRNVYAHAMWGFEILRALGGDKETVDAARQHFAAAIESGREREYVRLVEISALLRSYDQVWTDNLAFEIEAIRVMNDMRAKGEPRPTDFLKRRLWAIYHWQAVAADHLESLRPALPPAEHLATFRWAFPQEGLSEKEGPSLFNYLYVLAQLQEQAGDRAGAVDSYRKVVEEFSKNKYSGSRSIIMNERASAAIKRLSG